RFDPDRGFRLATYAMWWIKASIQEYILHSWSLVKIGTTAAQKKLFFNLRRLKSQMKAIDEGDLSPEQVKKMAESLAVSEEEVINMNRRLAAPDHSLNAPLREEGEGEWQDWLGGDARDQGGWRDVMGDERENQEVRLAADEELKQRQKLLGNAMDKLNPREQDILRERRLRD